MLRYAASVRGKRLDMNGITVPARPSALKLPAVEASRMFSHLLDP